jgi:hypothetical protein
MRGCFWALCGSSVGGARVFEFVKEGALDGAAVSVIGEGGNWDGWHWPDGGPRSSVSEGAARDIGIAGAFSKEDVPAANQAFGQLGRNQPAVRVHPRHPRFNSCAFAPLEAVARVTRTCPDDCPSS